MNGEAELMEQSKLSDAALLAQSRWYAVRTRSRHEKLVTRQLETQGIESIPSINYSNPQVEDRSKQVETPLFSGYAFLRMVLSPDDRVRVLRTQGS